MHEDATGNPKSFTPPFSAGYLHPKRLIPALVVGLLAVLAVRVAVLAAMAVRSDKQEDNAGARNHSL